MRRRKPFGPFRLARAERGLFSAPPPKLRQAHQLMAVGDYAAAAELFEQLAREGEASDFKRAPMMYLQAGRAYMWMGAEQTGLKLLKKGLSMLADDGRMLHFQRASRRIVAELQLRGLDGSASEIIQFLTMHASASAEIPTEPLAGVKRKKLPTHCPSCGGPLKPDDLEWLDDATAACDFCGSPVRGE